MNDEQIKALLRELSDKAVYEGKSETVRITLDPKEQRKPLRRPQEEEYEEEDTFEEEQDPETVGTADSEGRQERRKKKTSGDREGAAALKNVGAGILTGLSGVLEKAKTKRKPKERVFADVKAGEEPEETEQPVAAEAKRPAVTAQEEEDPLTDLLRPERIPSMPPAPQPEADEDEDEEAFDEDADEYDEEDEEDEETEEPKEKAPEFLPARKKKRETPVEPTDFESDAYLFRSNPEDEEAQEAQMPAFMKKAGELAAGAAAVIAGKAAAGKVAKKAKSDARAKAKAEAEEMKKATAEAAGEKEETKAEAEPKTAETAETAETKAPVEADAPVSADAQVKAETDVKAEPDADAQSEQEEKAQKTAQEEPAVKTAAKRTEEEEDFDEEPEGGYLDDDDDDPDLGGEAQPKAKPAKKAANAVSDFFKNLAHKGIAARELVMIAGGAVLLILLIALIMSSVTGKRKSQNVTADDGLRVLVEDEPTAWTKSAEVELTLRTSSPMQSITVNGENVEFSGEKKTRIKVTADQPDLKIMVVSEEKVLNADVQIPMIDSEAPLLDVSIAGDTVTLTSEDDGSGLKGIYYGVLDGFFDVAVYTPYTEPFKADPTKKYTIYAVDNAGNMNLPDPTFMIAATNLSIAYETLSLFPGETAQIGLTTEPAGALTSNLKVTSSDENVATISKSGVITAHADGMTQITATADGLPTVSCMVTVQSEATIKVTTLGDMTLGTDVNFSPQNSFDTVASMYGTGYFMQNVKSILEADDLTFANFEGTLTTQGTRLDKQYAFRGDPSYTNILTDGSIDVVTLANNHSHDYGQVSLDDTKNYLTAAGIDYCIGTETVVKEVNGIKVGLVGIYTLDEQDEEAQLHQAMEDVKAKGAQVIIVAFHWGTETETTPDDMQKSNAHEAVDLGADLVVGHHPHVLQGIEMYNGKYIAYSLGNFCFGGNTNPTTLDSMILQTTFTVGEGGDITDTTIDIIPILVSSSTSWNNYQPTPAEGERAESILNNVRQLSADLGTNLDL